MSSGSNKPSTPLLKHDSKMDAMRYLVMTWDEVASYQKTDAAASGTVRIADRTAGY